MIENWWLDRLAECAGHQGRYPGQGLERKVRDMRQQLETLLLMHDDGTFPPQAWDAAWAAVREVLTRKEMGT